LSNIYANTTESLKASLNPATDDDSNPLITPPKNLNYYRAELTGLWRKTVEDIIATGRIFSEAKNIIHGEQKIIQSYIWVTERERCWETRGLLREERVQVAQNSFRHSNRDLTAYLNNWDIVRGLDRDGERSKPKALAQSK
jgi:hypothetical protein